MLRLALEVIAETKPSSGKAKESYEALVRLVEGEKEVAWAEHQNSVILPHITAPHLADDMKSNISPAFLQSSGILTFHNISFDTTHDATVVGNNNGDSFDGENSRNIAAEMLSSSYPKQVDVNVIGDLNVISATSSVHSSANAIPCWANKTPVAMAIEQKEGVTTPLSRTVTKMPKSPHPRALQTSLATTHVITPLSHSNVSPFVPSSVVKEKQCVGMATSKYNTTPKCGYKPSTTDHRNVEKGTPGSKRPFAYLPPIFAPTLMKAKTESPDKVQANDCQSQTTELDCGAGKSEILGFEDDFVPFNAHPTPDQTEHNTTYHIDKESSMSLNQTYTQALSELEEERDISDGANSKAVARKVGQEIWQRVNNTDNQSLLSTMQCDEEHVKKIPGYLTMTKSAAIKRQPPTRQPLVRSNKENIPGGRKRTNTMKQSHRTFVRPSARSASLKSRPVTFNW